MPPLSGALALVGQDQVDGFLLAHEQRNPRKPSQVVTRVDAMSAGQLNPY